MKQTSKTTIAKPGPAGNASTQANLARILFSGQVAPGSRLVERDLARDLGLSRIPIREALMKLLAKGILVRDESNRGLRMRTYSAEEVRQLYELREAIEVAAARAACRHATEAELLRTDIISDHMEKEIGNYGSREWAELDRKFHETIMTASRNERFIKDFDLLINECQYVFYFHPALMARPNPTGEWIKRHMTEVLNVHRAITGAIRAGDEDKAQDLIREHMRSSVRSATEAIVTDDLAADVSSSTNGPANPLAATTTRKRQK